MALKGPAAISMEGELRRSDHPAMRAGGTLDIPMLSSAKYSQTLQPAVREDESSGE